MGVKNAHQELYAHPALSAIFLIHRVYVKFVRLDAAHVIRVETVLPAV